MSLKEIRRGNPIFTHCPICGHEGWCATIEGDDGNLYIVCKRDLTKLDTNGFTYIKDTDKEGNSLFVLGTREQMKDPNWKPIPPTVKKEKEINRFSDSKLHRIYKKMFSMLILEEKHREYLHSEGWTDAMIAHYNVKSWPVSDSVRFKEKVQTKNPKRSQIGRVLFEEFGDLTGLPGAHLTENKKTEELYWTFAGKDGIIFPLPNVYSQIVMCQIRLDNPDKGGKYRMLSSDKYYKNGCSPGSRITVVKPMIVGDTICIYLTEGFKKAVVAANKLNTIVTSIQGVNSWSELLDVNPETNERLVDVLKKQYRTVYIIVALDNDKYQNAKVMDSQTKILAALEEEQFQLATAEWDSYMGKGIDDMLIQGYTPQWFLWTSTK